MKDPAPLRIKSPDRLPLSESQLRAVFDSRTYNLILIDRDGRLLAFNKGAAQSAREIQGVEYEVGRDFFSYIPEPHRAKVRERHRRILEGESLNMETAYQGVDGMEHWYEIQYDPVRDEEGRITAVCLTNICIDERKRAEKGLRDSEASLRAIFNSGSQAILFLGMDGRIRTFNRHAVEAARMVGREMRAGALLMDYIPDPNLEEARAQFEKALRGQECRTETAFPAHDGTWRWVEVYYQPVLNDRGAVDGVCMTVQFIDERKKAESALRLSEETLRAVFNSGSQVTVLIGRDGRILKYNQSAQSAAPRILGRELRTGMPFLETLPPGADPEDFRRSFTEALRGLETKGEREIRSQGGHVRWVEVNYQPVFNERREVDGVCFSLSFIDERKNAEAALKESEERYRKLVEFSPEAVVVHSEGRIQYVNPSALRTFGVEKPEILLGRSILDFIHPDYRELMIGRVRKIVESGEPTEWIEAKLLAPDGRALDTETKGTPFHFQGRPSVLTMIRDITERKKNQGTLLRYERLATIGKVIAGIAHDIRNPLAVLSSMTQSLKERFKPTEPNAREVEAILAQTDRLKRFMSDILDYSRGLNLNREPVDIRRLLEQSLRWVQAQVGPSHEKVEVQWGLDPVLPSLSADTERLEQVLVNLLLNAYQAMEGGGTLSLSSEANFGWLALKIKDTGRGIPDADLARLFEPFFTTKKHGSGLGLSLSQKVVEAHGGKIEVQRVSPHGTLFTVLLPLTRKG